MTATRCEVLIVGGGLVGASLAVGLGMRGLSVTLVEAVPFKHSEQPSYDDRTIALSMGSRRILQALEIWPLLTAATPIERIHVSDRGRFGTTRLDCREERVAALGYVVENRLLGQALLARLTQLPSISVVCPARVSELQIGSSAVDITLTDGSAWRSSVVIGADGGQSAMRDQLELKAKTRDYDQVAVVTNVTTSEPHNFTAFERFTDDGPLAMLPMANDRCSVVWTQPTAKANSIIALSDADFCSALQAAFGWKLGAISRVGKRASYPLRLVVSPEQVRPRAVLLGNAAHTLHPIAGQGLNLSLRDVVVLTDRLVAAHAGGADIGGEEVLHDYWRSRQSDQRSSVAFTHGLATLFNKRMWPVVCARDAALVAFDAVTPLRRLLARHAMGMRGRLTRTFRV